MRRFKLQPTPDTIFSPEECRKYGAVMQVFADQGSSKGDVSWSSRVAVFGVFLRFPLSQKKHNNKKANVFIG